MNRKNFLRGIGLSGLASMLPLSKTKAAVNKLQAEGVDCVLIPSETAGPFPIDLSGDPDYFRVDITDDYPGIPLNLSLTILNTNDDCSPVANARVDVWHCDKDGYYSGFVNTGYLGTQDNSSKRFCRGIQLTDAAGKAVFTSIYPGWYPGRVSHIHFEVYISSVLKATSQLAFPDAINDTVYTTPLYTAHGINPDKNADDSILNSPPGALAYEMVSVVENADTGGYDASITVGIAGPLTDLINNEPETGGQFILGQNVPNPFSGETWIPVTLQHPAQVHIEIFDMSARKIAHVFNNTLPAGQHTIKLNAEDFALSGGNYVYQFSSINDHGTFRQCKVMTVK